MRLMQHKKEAYWFYWYLSNFYDKFVNPLFWTARMRDESLSIAQLDSPGLKVIDVGSGTGFTTQGIVEHVPASQVTCVDQSPHQMSKAKRKADLQGCTFLLGDAENIPFPTDSFDRYVSAGSIEYWPDPQKGITEAYRVIKPGGIALLIGPLEPVNRFSRFIADTWMLFPKDSEYRERYKNAGFTDIQVRYVRPAWYRSKVEYGIAIAGRKPAPGESPYAAPAKAPVEESTLTFGRRLQLIWRVVAGSTAGFLFIPGALIGYLRTAFDQRGQDVPAKYREGLNGYQITALLVIAAIIGGIVWRVLYDFTSTPSPMSLNSRISHFYDRSTPIWLDTWGEHMHHGYYGPDGKTPKDKFQAQIDLVEELLKLGNVTRARHLLDAGCGVGGSARYLAQRFGATALGLTLSAVQAREAEAYTQKAGLSEQVRFQVRDMMTLLPSDGPFDLVWSMESAEHIADKQRLFDMFYQLLSPGGTLLMATWCHRPLPPELNAREQALLQKIYDLYHLPPMVPRQALEEMATRAGFTRIRSEDWSQSVSPFWGEVIRSALTLRSLQGLLRAGLPTLKGAWAMRYMNQGYRRGLIEFAVLAAQKS